MSRGQTVNDLKVSDMTYENQIPFEEGYYMFMVRKPART
jgi:hypothetical protein